MGLKCRCKSPAPCRAAAADIFFGRNPDETNQRLRASLISRAAPYYVPTSSRDGSSSHLRWH
eukprot:1398767-Pyramimonas_sp.AAC.1